nr:ribonuclease H-like domain-containing protein [Tanacetum cinerariifolium]
MTVSQMVSKEVILNGDSPPPTRIVDGVVQIITPTTAEQRKTSSCFLRSLSLEWKTHTLSWQNKADLEEKIYDDLFNNLKIYEDEVKGLSPSSQNTQNIDFMSLNNTDSTNKSVNAAPSISAASFKAKVFTLPNVDSLSDAVQMEQIPLGLTCPKLNVIIATEESILPGNTDHQGTTGTKKLLKELSQWRDNALAELKIFLKAKKERNDLKLTLDKFQTLFKNLSKLLESQVSDKTGLGFDSQVFNCQVSDYEEFHSHESDNRVPKNPKNDRYKTCEGYHVVPPPYNGTFLPPKPDLVFTDDLIASESVPNVFNVESSKNKPSKDMSKNIGLMPLSLKIGYLTLKMKLRLIRMNHPYSNRNVVPTAVLTRSRLVSLNAARLVPTAITQSTMKSTWPVKHVVNNAHSPVKRPINHRTATKNNNFNKKVTTVKGNPQQALKDKGVIDSGYSRHIIGNISFLSEFEEIDGGYVAFGGNPKGGKISGKGKIKTGNLDFDDALSRSISLISSVSHKWFQERTTMYNVLKTKIRIF